MNLKKVLILILTLVLALSCISIPALADGEDGKEGGEPLWADGATPNGNQIFYTATEQVEPVENLISSYSSDGSSFKDGKGIMAFTSKISTIPTGAFQSKEALTSITLPSTITSIDADAFNGCTGMKYIFASENSASLSGCGFYPLNVYGPECGTLTVDGNTEIAGCTFYAKAGAEYTVTATPNADCYLDTFFYRPKGETEVDFTISDAKVANTASFTMPEKATTVAASFVPNDYYGLSFRSTGLLNGEEGGAKFCVDSSGVNYAKANDTVYIDPADNFVGYTAVNLVAIGVSTKSEVTITLDEERREYYFTMPAESVIVTANYAKTSDTCDLDLEDSTADILVSTTVDQQYIRTVAESTAYNNRIAVAWSSDTMNIKVANAKKWNPSTLEWVTDEDKNGVATVRGGSNVVTFTLTNYSAKAFNCSLTFTAAEGEEDKYSKLTTPKETYTLAAVINDPAETTTAKQYLDGNGKVVYDDLPTAVIRAVITPNLTGVGSFEGASAAEKTKYGTFTIACTAAE